MPLQVATAAIIASSTFMATGNANHAVAAAISASASMAASATETQNFTLPTFPTTGGFAGINVNPVPYIYAAVQAIKAAITSASNGGLKATAVLVMGPLPYVQIYGQPGSPMAIATGSYNTTLSQQTMIAAMGVVVTPFTAKLWSAVANAIFTNPAFLLADGFHGANATTSNGASVVDITS